MRCEMTFLDRGCMRLRLPKGVAFPKASMNANDVAVMMEFAGIRVSEADIAIARLEAERKEDYKRRVKAEAARVRQEKRDNAKDSVGQHFINMSMGLDDDTAFYLEHGTDEEYRDDDRPSSSSSSSSFDEFD